MKMSAAYGSVLFAHQNKAREWAVSYHIIYTGLGLNPGCKLCNHHHNIEIENVSIQKEKENASFQGSPPHSLHYTGRLHGPRHDPVPDPDPALRGIP